MSSDLAIRVDGLGKRFKLGTRERYRTFRDAVMTKLRRPFARNGHDEAAILWALRDVSFEINRGDVVGVIGGNGAGKSTLLKVLSRITEPTEGTAEIHGRVASLLEVGTGFHPELSGRENIYLNGAILGMRRAEIDRKLDEIVAFAEVEKFLDTAVKHYSSGMYLRLAFSVAASLEPEILLVDEVLAVGDIAFQNKCLRRMGQVAGEGRTVLLVSHNLGAISSLTRRCLWLKAGKVEAFGRTDEVIPAYLRDTNAEGQSVAGKSEIDDPVLGSLLCELGIPGTSPNVPSNEPIPVSFRFQIKQPVTGLRIGFDLVSGSGAHVFRAYFDDSDPEPGPVAPGNYHAVCTIPGDWLNQGDYYVTVRANIDSIRHIVILERALGFRVLNIQGPNSRYGADRPGLLNPRLAWAVESSQ